MILRVLGKKYSKDILLLLKKNGEMGFQEILSNFDIHKSLLSRTLTELTDCCLITSRLNPESNRTIPSKLYTITGIGVEALKIYDFEEELDNFIYGVKKEFKASLKFDGPKDNKNSIEDNNNNSIVNSYNNVGADNTIVTNSHNIHIKK
ncbi:DNA-binding HxlR family transcriptional regulator [Methanococcus voltae]|uniref:DNA-binding HxlR family transcriptional regulator n=1 Tax=Methanococcus voltae TaxID=2188 RepID=A0A8J7RGW9_METVO|nr:hypothetical protein [Methanococcus voltae]MBP2202199.1 DNA-binding HxlR family transcriptional regulator [Methanococcus voltae]